MMTLEILRALSGIAASDKLTEGIRERAEKMMQEIMDVLAKQIKMEASMMTKASAEMNGIIS